ncbi:MAG TPA: GxxExxY protein [Aggregatilineaceae bacterium]|nr:GxxExxY protein [Aggregatilineaceae bacterium]
MHYNEISGAVVDAAMKVHTALGPGLMENVYEACLAHELNKRGFRTASQLPLPVKYGDVRIDLGFRLDILVEDTVVVEIKAVDAINPIHQAQLLTFLKLSGKYLGLLINFNVVHLRDGIRRMVNGEPPVSSVSSVVNPGSVSSVSSVVKPGVSSEEPACARR